MRKQLAIASVTAGVLTLIGVLYAATPPRHLHQDDSKSGAIEGRVLDAEGQPVSRATVYVDRYDLEKWIRPSVRTDQQGVFLIKGLAPGRYIVYGGKEKDGYPDSLSTFHSPDPQIVRVNVYEQQVARGIVIQFGPKAAKLVGRVICTATNEPIKDASVTLRRADNPEYSYQIASNPEGAFKILVPSVPFTLEVSAPGYEDWRYTNTNSSEQANALQVTSGDTKKLTIALRPAR